VNSFDLLILKKSSIFAALEDDEIRELANLVVERPVAAGETIFWEGDSSDWFYIIASGQIKVTKLSSLGKETIIAFFGTGEMFGEGAVFDNKPYPASSQAVG